MNELLVAPNEGARLASLELGVSERAAFLNSILESSTEYSIVAKDLDGTIRAWNEGARRLYGYDPFDVVGKESASRSRSTPAPWP